MKPNKEAEIPEDGYCDNRFCYDQKLKIEEDFRGDTILICRKCGVSYIVENITNITNPIPS